MFVTVVLGQPAGAQNQIAMRWLTTQRAAHTSPMHANIAASSPILVSRERIRPQCRH